MDVVRAQITGGGAVNNLTVRDYFAAQLASTAAYIVRSRPVDGLYSLPSDDRQFVDEVTSVSYMLADAFIKARALKL